MLEKNRYINLNSYKFNYFYWLLKFPGGEKNSLKSELVPQACGYCTYKKTVGEPQKIGPI